MIRLHNISTILLFVVSLGLQTAFASADEPADTSSPRSTLKSFIDSTNKVYLEIRSKK